MPAYDYRCRNGHKWELQRRISEVDGPAWCPECDAPGQYMFSSAPRTLWFPGSTRTFTPSAKEKRDARNRHE
jgi:putative FmdB family regulatory protein